MTDKAEALRTADWDLRPWLLAGLLAATGLAIHILTDDAQDSGIRMALAALVGVGAIAFAFTLEPDETREPAIFAAIVGLVVGGLVWRAVGQGDDIASEEYGVMAGIFACGLALPLFQAGFHKLRWRTSYADTHYHVWTDAISAGGALAFMGLSWLVLVLVAALLDLVGIPLEDIIDEGWFGWTYSGAALGAALGVLRNQRKIIGTLQSVVLTIFSLLAVPVALAVIVFLAAVLVSGPAVLWDATDSSTPILLSIAAGSFILVNSIIRDNAEAMSVNRVQRIAAMVLALGILPLTIFATISMGVRIGQHGLSPERLWGLAAIVVAVAYGIAYFFDMVRGRKGGWPEALRTSNLRLAVGTAAYALFLALPILNFGAISANNQIARLQSGDVSAADFDFDALKWDFGAAGRERLDELAKSSDADIAKRAENARKREERPWRYRPSPARERELAAERRENLTIDGGDESLRVAITDYVSREGRICRNSCRAIVIGTRDEGTHVALVSGYRVEHVAFDGQGGATRFDNVRGTLVARDSSGASRALEGPEEDISGDASTQPYEGQQLFIDGKPVGNPFR